MKGINLTKFSEYFAKANFKDREEYPEAHTIDGEKVAPDGVKEPVGGGGINENLMSSEPIGLSYPDGQDFGPYIQHLGEGLMPSFALNFQNKIPFSCGNIHPHTAMMLFSLVLNQRPQVIVETGTFYGYSTWFMAQALQVWGEGTIYTIDNNPKLVAEEVLKHSNVICYKGDSRAVIPKLIEEVGEMQFAFIDSYKRIAMTEFDLIHPHIPPGGLVVFHDTQFLNTGYKLFQMLQHRVANEELSYEIMMFAGTPHRDNPHRYFGNADDRGLMVMRKWEKESFLHVRDASSSTMGDRLI